MRKDNLIIDCFAGGGGASVGIEMAIGRSVDIAINHDADAIRMHLMNHPDTLHLTEDIFAVDLAKYVDGRHVALMWASPSCTHFSNARGGVPLSNQLRILPWSVYKHAKAIKPDVIIMENVPEIQTWGPLDSEGRPIKEKKGYEYNRFISGMKSLGYIYDSKELIAADYGAPTIRKRWFAIFRCDKRPIVWPEKTHDRYGLAGKPKWVSASEVIDFSNVGKSVYHRSKPLAEKTIIRINKGIEKFVAKNKKAVSKDTLKKMNVDDTIINSCTHVSNFIMEYYGQGVGSDVNEPLHTIVTKDRFALISVFLDENDNQLDVFLRMLTPTELKLAQGFPKDYIIDKDLNWKPISAKDQVLRIGNSVVPIMSKVLVEANLPELKKNERIPNIHIASEANGQLAFA